ncbi:universal stress protein [Macrococcoides canis]|uniref:universal stress protein n=1 Tax=Macrococcoides canis TaxID=1855823 RepID=UPI0013E96728|nr:universal stress protein [Macrococcus canis]QIH75073.1 universal stress protein [Macrococcus canis]
MYQAVLIAVDGSHNSMRAAEEAIKLNAEHYTILSVITAENSKESVLHGTGDSEADRKKELADIITKFSGRNFEVMFEHGYPKDKIVEIANHHNYDLLVIGTRGLSGLKEVVMGSVSRHVVKQSEINVLVVK